MARVVALATRIAWALHPDDENLAIASQIFVAAGVLLLFITNLVFAQRMIRAYHRFFGWSAGLTGFFWGLFGSIVVVLVMVITVTIQSFFTLNRKTHRIDKGIQLFCGVYLGVIAFLPIPLVLAAALVPRRTPIDRFGVGHFRTKFGLLTFTSVLLATGAIFRAATNFVVRPLNDPAWPQTKTAFYCFNFGIELVVVITYLLSRFDRRFHIPDGSSAPGHYSMSEYGVLAGAGTGENRRRTWMTRNSTVTNGGGGATIRSSDDTGGKRRIDRAVLDPVLDAAPPETGEASFTPAADLPPHIYELPTNSRVGSHWSLLSGKKPPPRSLHSRKSDSSFVYGGGGDHLSFPLPLELPFSEHQGSVAAGAPAPAGSTAGDPDMEWMARAMVCFYSSSLPSAVLSSFSIPAVRMAYWIMTDPS